MSKQDPIAPTGVTRRAFGQVMAGTAVARAFSFPLASQPMPTQSPNRTNELCFLSARELTDRMRKKQVSAREVLAQYLEQIERVNPQVNAIVTLVAERAMA